LFQHWECSVYKTPRISHHSKPNRSTKSVARRYFGYTYCLYEARMKIRPGSVIFTTPCLLGSGYPDGEDFRVAVQADWQGKAITKQAAECRLQGTGEPDNHLKLTKL